MPLPPSGPLFSLRRTRLIATGLVCLVVGLAGGPAPLARAAHYRVRSVSIARATQYYRTDRTISAPRIFTQGLSLWGYDLMGDRTGSLNVHVSLRYNTDFSLDRRERDNPYFADQWNELSLDVAYLDWRPARSLRVRLGRQWSMGALGVRDFDGLRAAWRPRIGPETRAHLVVYGGHDVETAYGQFDAAQFDVQGLPPDEGIADDRLDGLHLIGGGAAGLSWGRDASVEVSYRRRWSVGLEAAIDGADTVVGSERVGAAASASFHPRLTASAYGSMGVQLQGVDRAGAQLGWQIPGGGGVVSGGVEHRHPWFDSSSIFNLFGARPHQSAFVSYQLPVDSWRTDLQLRGWGRQYHGDPAAVAGGVDAADERAVGGALSHSTRLRVARKPIRWHSLVSYQSSLDRGTGQFVADSRLRMPVWDKSMFVSARGLMLAALTQSRRFDSQGYAATGVVGVDIPVSTLGTLSGAVETTGGSFYPVNTSVYATFAVEHWP